MSDPQPSPGPYQVVARRFRPQAFDEVVGQDHILKSLRSALGSARVPHALLFSGSRGVGKTTLARIMARALNCEKGPTPDPCGTCGPCLSILGGSNLDVVEIDAASNRGIDDARALRDRIGFASMGSRYKVYILDEVHMFTTPAWNAFLKTLEEPPPGVVFILATTELHKVPETIRSRCQVLLFRRVGEPDIGLRLRMIADREGVALPEEVLAEIAASCRGGMRDAETALERILPIAREMGDAFDLGAYRQLVQRVGPDRVIEVVQTLLAGEAAPALHFAAELIQGGGDEREGLGEVLEVLRALLLLKVDGADSGLVGHGGAQRARLQELAGSCELARLEAMIQAGLLGRERIRRLEDRALVLELTMLRMASAGQLATLAELVAEVRAGGIPAATVQVPTAASAPTPAPAGGASLAPAADVGDLRSRLLQRLRDSKGLLARTVEHCRVDGPDAAGVVTLRLQTDKKMHRDRLAAEAVQQDLAATLTELVGSAVNVVVAGGSPAAADRPAGRRRKPSPGPVTRKVVERFDGQIVEVDDDRDD